MRDVVVVGAGLHRYGVFPDKNSLALGTAAIHKGAGGAQYLEGLKVYRDFYFLAFAQRLIAKFRGTRRISVWQLALAFSTVLVLLASLLWLAPWQVRHDGPATVPQPMPRQGNDRTAEETTQPTPPALTSPTVASAGPSQIPEAGTAHEEPAPQSPALLPEKSEVSSTAPAQERHTPVTSEEPAEVLDIQAMQRLITRLETARSTPEERLDTKAMDHLLARLEPADQTALPTAPRSKAVRKKRARSVPRASAGRGAPGSVSPHS